MRTLHPVYAPSLFRPRRSRLSFLQPPAAPTPTPTPAHVPAAAPAPTPAPAAASWAFLRADAVEHARRDHPKAYAEWSAADEARLRELHARGWGIDALAVVVGRTPGAVRARLRRLSLAA